MISEFDPQAAAAISDDLALLARLHDREIDAPLIAAMRVQPIENWFALRMNTPAFEEAAQLFEIALNGAPDPLTQEALDELAVEYAAIYLNHVYRVSPHESVWVDEDGLERQAPMFRVREWYARFGFRAPDWRRRSDDHIAHEFAFLSQIAPGLTDREEATKIADFLREHPLVWVPDFAGRVARRCQSPFYAGVAVISATYLRALGDLLERVYGLDLTPIEPATAKSAPAARTCADPPPRYAPGLGPGW